MRILVVIVAMSFVLQGCAANDGRYYHGAVVRAEEARTLRMVETIKKQFHKPAPVYRWKNTIKVRPKK